MRLFIEPSDVWLFRDGRPFSAESDHRAASLFPPPPSVLQGALRAAHVALRGARMDDYVQRRLPQIEAEIGAPGEPPKFAMHGPFIARRTNGAIVRYLPIPADATRAGDKFAALAPHDLPDLRTNLPAGMKLLWREQSETPSTENQPRDEREYRWATESAVLRYLAAPSDAAEIPVADALTDDDLFERENRFGIGLDYAARRPQDGALYEVEFIRPCPNVGIEVQVDGLSGWSDTGLLKLGGEGHMARFQKAGEETALTQTLSSRFKLYFATATYFATGWRPTSWDAFFAGEVPALVAAALPRYEAHGGFDLFGQKHKPAQRLVPAGSVYFFEGSADTRLAQSNVTQSSAELGFGQIRIGRW